MENNLVFIIVLCFGTLSFMSFLDTKGTYDTITYAVDTIYSSINRVQSQSIERYHNLYDDLYNAYEEIEDLKNKNKILEEKVDLLETVVYNKFVRNRG